MTWSRWDVTAVSVTCRWKPQSRRETEKSSVSPDSVELGEQSPSWALDGSSFWGESGVQRTVTESPPQSTDTSAQTAPVHQLSLTASTEVTERNLPFCATAAATNITNNNRSEPIFSRTRANPCPCFKRAPRQLRLINSIITAKRRDNALQVTHVTAADYYSSIA